MGDFRTPQAVAVLMARLYQATDDTLKSCALQAEKFIQQQEDFFKHYAKHGEMARKVKNYFGIALVTNLAMVILTISVLGSQATVVLTIFIALFAASIIGMVISHLYQMNVKTSMDELNNISSQEYSDTII